MNPGKNRFGLVYQSGGINPAGEQMMSVDERRWATEQLKKPAALMSDEEWEAHKAWVDTQRSERGEKPIDWRGVPKPRPTSARTLEYLRSTLSPDQ
jgi:hypothetical protein